MAQYAYTTSARIQTRISTLGLTLRTDDTTTPLGATLTADMIDRAGDDCEAYVWSNYSLLSLSTNSWFAQRVTDYAVFYICERRLNVAPDPALRAFERAETLLERVHTGQLAIPNAARNKGAAPALSNLRVTQRPFNRVVVERLRSKTTAAKTADGYTPNYDLTEWFDPAGNAGFGGAG